MAKPSFHDGPREMIWQCDKFIGQHTAWELVQLDIQGFSCNEILQKH